MRYNEYEPFRSVDEARVLIVLAQTRSGRHEAMHRGITLTGEDQVIGSCSSITFVRG
jgi:hypothetical protein